MCKEAAPDLMHLDDEGELVLDHETVDGAQLDQRTGPSYVSDGRRTGGTAYQQHDLQPRQAVRGRARGSRFPAVSRTATWAPAGTTAPSATPSRSSRRTRTESRIRFSALKKTGPHDTNEPWTLHPCSC
ncbi:hypothetical protein [Streptomyces sp. NPDC002758]